MAAIADVYQGLSSVNADAVLSIQPSAGNEVAINNIYHEDDIELQLYDGTNTLTFASDSGKGVFARYVFRCTNSKYIRIKNKAAIAKLIGYDGIYTKVP